MVRLSFPDPLIFHQHATAVSPRSHGRSDGGLTFGNQASIQCQSPEPIQSSHVVLESCQTIARDNATNARKTKKTTPPWSPKPCADPWFQSQLPGLLASDCFLAKLIFHPSSIPGDHVDLHESQSVLFRLERIWSASTCKNTALAKLRQQLPMPQAVQSFSWSNEIRFDKSILWRQSVLYIYRTLITEPKTIMYLSNHQQLKTMQPLASSLPKVIACWTGPETCGHYSVWNQTKKANSASEANSACTCSLKNRRPDLWTVHFDHRLRIRRPHNHKHCKVDICYCCHLKNTLRQHDDIIVWLRFQKFCKNKTMQKT